MIAIDVCSLLFCRDFVLLLMRDITIGSICVCFISGPKKINKPKKEKETNKQTNPTKGEVKEQWS